jgi:hypothetical protein
MATIFHCLYFQESWVRSVYCAKKGIGSENSDWGGPVNAGDPKSINKRRNNGYYD